MKKLTKLLIVLLALNATLLMAYGEGDSLFEPTPIEQPAPPSEEPHPPADPAAPAPVIPSPVPPVPVESAAPAVPIKPKERKTVELVLGKSIAKVNKKEVKLSTAAQSIEGRTYLPLRFLSEEILGASVNYNSATKDIVIKGEETTAKVTINKKAAQVNGKKIAMEVSPLVKNGATLLPLRFFVDHFGLTVSYDPAKKLVVVKDKIQDLNPPVADFDFLQPSYVQGQKIEFTDKSTDADGDQIIAREWSLASNPTVKNSDLNKLFANVAPGEYQVMYRVQSSQKAWSQWIQKPFTYEKNQPPTLSDVYVNKKDLGRGEDFEIIYTQHNEPWEMITDTIWTYRHESQDPSKAIIAKPTKFFSSGKYYVTLQLKDAFGNLSEPSEVEVNVGTRVVQTQLDYFAKGGGSINTPLENYDNTNYLQKFKNLGDLKFEDKPGLLIMSDSPENVYDIGILYQETITSQKGRLLTYHVNKIPAPKGVGAGVVVIVENMDMQPINFSLERTGMKGPSPDPHEVGGKVLDTHFLANSPWKSTPIDVGKSAIVYDSRDNLNWKADNLISMLSEFETTGIIKMTIAAFGPTTKLEHLNLLQPLPTDQHPRGTFNVIERTTSINVPEKEATGVLLGKDANEWITGTDGITGQVAVNRGNYGVEHKITVTPEDDTLMFINCRGGAFRGFVGWHDGINRTVSSYGPHDARYLGKITGGQSTTIRYMLANGSASPVQIGFIPRSMWEK